MGREGNALPPRPPLRLAPRPWFPSSVVAPFRQSGITGRSMAAPHRHSISHSPFLHHQRFFAFAKPRRSSDPTCFHLHHHGHRTGTQKVLLDRLHLLPAGRGGLLCRPHCPARGPRPVRAPLSPPCAGPSLVPLWRLARVQTVHRVATHRPSLPNSETAAGPGVSAACAQSGRFGTPVFPTLIFSPFLAPRETPSHRTNTEEVEVCPRLVRDCGA